MSTISSAIYTGTVAHTRLRPIKHSLSYRVFTLLLDVSQFDAVSRKLKFLSYNRFNLLSIHDADYGDGTPLAPYLDAIAEKAGKHGHIRRFVMLCYPRVLGYVFNPLTVYFGLDADDNVRLTVYEVSNTFGERKTYVLPANPDHNGLISQHCPKDFFVSPFNRVEGDYSFHLTPIGNDLTVGVTLRDDSGPLLRAHFRGDRKDLTDLNLARAVLATGWMTLKVTLGIHIEAAKLWLKGLRTVKKPPAPETPVNFHGKAPS